MQSVWQRVAEDYRAVRRRRHDPGPRSRGHHADRRSGPGLRHPCADLAEHHAASSICSGGCGGIAYIGVFDIDVLRHAHYQPAWIFPQSLGNDAKNIAEAVSHEVGHNLGLSHDGVAGGTSYYGGHDTWAPIMGVGYSRPITQWSQGDYTGANNAQDDLAVIRTTAPRAPDEEPAARRIRRPATGRTAYITTDADRDIYSLGACSGGLPGRGARRAEPEPRPRAQPAEASPPIRRGRQPAVEGRHSVPGRGEGIDATVVRDRGRVPYFVAVDGVGNGSPTNGYDGYASVGAYTLCVNGNCQSGPGNALDAPGRPRYVDDGAP